MSIRNYKKSLIEGGFNTKKKFSEKSLVPNIIRIDVEESENEVKSERQKGIDGGSCSPTRQMINQ